MTKLFLSYARGDDEPFVRRPYKDLSVRAFDVWFDRVSIPSRNLTLHQEMCDAMAACDRPALAVGPEAIDSDYVRQEWQFAQFEADKVVTPVLRLGEHPLGLRNRRRSTAKSFATIASMRSLSINSTAF